MQTIDDSKMCLVKLPNCANCAQNKFFLKLALLTDISALKSLRGV